jgi:hypothetical protein
MVYKNLLTPAAGVLVGWLVLLCLIPKKNMSVQDDRRIRSYEIVALLSFVAIPVFEYAASKLTGAPFLARYGLSTIAGFAGLLGVTVGRKPVVAIGTLVLLIGQISFAFLGFATGSVLIEPSSGYKISTRIQEFRERYEWMGEEKALPIVLLDGLDSLPTAYYAPRGVTSQLIYSVWGKNDINGEGFALLRACCKAEPSVIEISDFLQSHKDFSVYGGRVSAYRILYFSKNGATLKVIERSADHVLVLVTYPATPPKETSR